MISKLKNSILFFLIFFGFSLKADIAENILSEMSLDEKIGQLFMIPACPKKDHNHFNDLEKLIKNFHIGGIIIKASDPESQIKFLNKLQSISKYPLIVSADAEWGLGMRMDNTIAFPKNMTLGAIYDDQLLYELGKEIGNELKSVGVHINLAPVVDINNNPSNPIINIRSFSDDKYLVAKKASYIIKGMQEENIICCIKHFPGYGDITIDPHLDLPLSYNDYERLKDIEFFPYDYLIKDDLKAVMTGHVILPNLSKMPSCLSKEILDILINEKKFNNLIITDALNMKALTNHFTFEEIAFYALTAGNDILLYGDHIGPNIDDILKNQIPRAFNAIKEAVFEKKISQDEIDFHVLKILKAKEKLNLFDSRFVSDYDQNKILSPYAYNLKKKLFDNALTIVKKNNFLPINTNKNNLYLTTKSKISNDLIVNKFFDKFTSFNINEFYDLPSFDISPFDTIIIGIYESDLTDELIKKIKTLKYKNVVLFFFGSVYKLKPFLDFENIILGYEEDDDAVLSTIKYILGQINPIGILPIKSF